jgi:hypothetical protein
VKEKEKEKAFSEHAQEAFSALRDARGVGVAGVGVAGVSFACRAWLRDGSRSLRRDDVVLIH